MIEALAVSIIADTTKSISCFDETMAIEIKLELVNGIPNNLAWKLSRSEPTMNFALVSVTDGKALWPSIPNDSNA